MEAGFHSGHGIMKRCDALDAKKRTNNSTKSLYRKIRYCEKNLVTVLWSILARFIKRKTNFHWRTLQSGYTFVQPVYVWALVRKCN